MRKVICLILVLVICMSMALPAFASSPACKDHKDANGDGLCDICGKSMNNAGAGSAAGNPRTGDIIMMWVVIMIAALAAIAGAVVIYRKKFA